MPPRPAAAAVFLLAAVLMTAPAPCALAAGALAATEVESNATDEREAASSKANSSGRSSSEAARHGFAYFDELKYEEGFEHFAYANPDAPKEGTLRMGSPGTFNNLHDYVDKGIVALGSASGVSWTHDSLMKGSQDELSSVYAWLAESVAVADDLGWVEFKLRQGAYWHDKVPVTVDDVVWTFNTIKSEGSIAFKAAYRDTDRIEQTGPRSFKFHFREGAEWSRRLVLQMCGFMPLPKHYWQDKDFTATTLVPPLGNGPYRITEVDGGRKIVYERVEDYWGRDLNVNIGYNNFERLVYLYFRDMKVLQQALKAQVIDYWREQNEQDFHTAYDFPAAKRGLFKKVTFQSGMSYGMHWGVMFNTRLDKFSDIRVREALTFAYDFDWANRTLWHGALIRNTSFFSGSNLESSGLPKPEELELLEPFRGQIPDRVFTEVFKLPESDGYGRNRDGLARAHALLEEAGWVLDNFERRHKVTGERMRIEFLVMLLEHQRMLVPFIENLERLGIDAVLRKVENNTYLSRMRQFDFEVTITKVYQHPIPLPALIRRLLLSENADRPNQLNYSGIKSPAVDSLVERIISASSEEEMNVAGRALDRVLQWSFILIPEGRPTGRHLVYWDRFGSPELGKENMNWTGFPYLWWFDREKSARVDAGLKALEG